MSTKEYQTITVILKNGKEYGHTFEKDNTPDRSMIKLRDDIDVWLSRADKGGLLVLNNPHTVYRLDEVVAVRYYNSEPAPKSMGFLKESS